MNLSQAKLNFKCPKCGVDNPFTLAQAQKGEPFNCVGCGISIVLKDDGSVKKAQEEIDRSLNDFSKKIKEINGKLNIKI